MNEIKQDIKTAEKIIAEFNNTNPISISINNFDLWMIQKEKRYLSCESEITFLQKLVDGYSDIVEESLLIKLEHRIKELKGEKK